MTQSAAAPLDVSETSTQEEPKPAAVKAQPFSHFFSPFRDKAFLVILFFYLSSFWFFSFWVLKNHGVVWSPPSNMNHHPFDLHALDTQFTETLLYLFSQNPFYTVITWLLLKTDPASDGFAGFMVLHYLLGFLALISLYKLLHDIFRVPNMLSGFALSAFVFNAGFYRAFTSGWYDFPTLCLVCILTYCFANLVYRFNRLNLLWFIFTLTILVMYRNSFHPLLFFIPTIVLLASGIKSRWKIIFAAAVIPFLITILPNVKNYVIFGTFQNSINSLALNIKTISFEFLDRESLLDEIDAGHINPIALCYSRALESGAIIYHGTAYTRENCDARLLRDFAQPERTRLLSQNPRFNSPLILREDIVSFGQNVIPNTLSGFIVANQIIRDSQSYLTHHPEYYGRKVLLNSISRLFRSTQLHEFLIANNERNYPEWFGSRLFDLDIFKVNAPGARFDTVFRPVILMGILCSLTYALLFAAGVRKRNLFSLIHFAGLFLLLSPLLFGSHLFTHLYSRFLLPSLFWTLLFMLPALALTMANLLFRKFDDAEARMQLLLTFIAWVCIYVMGLHILIAGSELERYRFSVDGLLLVLFLFWINSMYCTIARWYKLSRFNFTA
ncbi:hypothetical protein AQUSIP_18030 [Aquicella siphonis]|uniref:Uncharacterized protein n=1 Tax=Aquicella siphonis TaxID=254247 RepID=A0A5E4PHI9_9COXI|nr:hypothetical protein [Aquicella siphonis]VVC76490.1 hypothetical protein AQUSIP_18030 [Aquicella siphonis]